ncbi:MAG: hypothetical protein ACOC9P_01880 [bacterium]
MRGVQQVVNTVEHHGEPALHAPHLLSASEKIGLGVYELRCDRKQSIPLRGELSEEELEAEMGR